MKKSISKTIQYSCVVIFALSLSSFALQEIIHTKNKETKSTSNGFAILELFTSQGCSSCPPADALMGKYVLGNNPNIIPLSFHVDYWNYIGWKDPFSKAAFSNRQREYAQLMNTRGSYTPQVIINGKYELIASEESAVQSKVSQELAMQTKENLTISQVIIVDGKLKINYTVNRFTADDVVNFALVKKKELTAIKRGENSGLKLTNYNIVFDFATKPISKKNDNIIEFEFNNDWIPSDFKIVAYMQSSQNGIIASVAQKEIK